MEERCETRLGKTGREKSQVEIKTQTLVWIRLVPFSTSVSSGINTLLG